MKLQFNREIKTAILQALGDHHHATKLELMYHCMLCQESLDKYLQNLIEEGLISPSHGGRRFYVTADGLEFLNSNTGSAATNKPLPVHSLEEDASTWFF
jgi:predicted transcriptional regulator